MIQTRPPWWVGQWIGAAGNPAGPNLGLMFQPGYEPCLFYGNRYGIKACIPDVWRASPESDRNGHPCPKPLTLMRTILYQLKPESVLDPFAGTGTTLVAAKDLGIRAIGIEIEERYCEVAARRCSQEVLGLLDELADTRSALNAATKALREADAALEARESAPSSELEAPE